MQAAIGYALGKPRDIEPAALDPAQGGEVKIKIAAIRFAMSSSSRFISCQR